MTRLQASQRARWQRRLDVQEVGLVAGDAQNSVHVVECSQIASTVAAIAVVKHNQNKKQEK